MTKMTIERLMEGILLPQEAVHLIRRTALSSADHQKWHTLFFGNQFSSEPLKVPLSINADTAPFFRELRSADGWKSLALYLYTHFALVAHEEYLLRQIPDEIFFSTFSDISIWCRHCIKKYGTPGLEEVEWLQRHLQLKLFRLGRLQFEPLLLKEPISVETSDFQKTEGFLPAGAAVLNVHIPEDGALSFSEAQASLQSAPAFFREFFKEESTAFICRSWLLASTLKKFLNSSSNILKFQTLFCSSDQTDPSFQAEERIFGEILEQKTAYPEHTSLQRSAKAHILSGGEIGMGLGIRMI